MLLVVLAALEHTRSIPEDCAAFETGCCLLCFLGENKGSQKTIATPIIALSPVLIPTCNLTASHRLSGPREPRLGCRCGAWSSHGRISFCLGRAGGGVLVGVPGGEVRGAALLFWAKKCGMRRKRCNNMFMLGLDKVAKKHANHENQALPPPFPQKKNERPTLLFCTFRATCGSHGMHAIPLQLQSAIA